MKAKTQSTNYFFLLNSGDPVGGAYIKYVSDDFYDHYLLPALNNPQDLPLIYDWSTEVNQHIVDSNLDQNDEIGLAFNYVLDSYEDVNGVTQKYFTYAISLANYNPVTGIETFGFGSSDTEDGYFLLLQRNKSIIAKPWADLDSFMIGYESNVSNSNHRSTKVPVPLSQIIHPRLSYFKGRNFLRFYNENRAFSDQLHVFVDHGAIFAEQIESRHNPGTYSPMYVQTPVIFFVDGDQWQDENQRIIRKYHFNPDRPYEYRAMDVGRLCPPDCIED